MPPRGFYPSSIRSSLGSKNLLTLPTHMDCNNSFKNDEEYFCATLVLMVMDSGMGNKLFLDFVASLKSHKPGQRLLSRVLGEFNLRPDVIQPAPGFIGKHYDRDRVHRILWKIVRGLYFEENGRTKLLPDDRLCRCQMVSDFLFTHYSWPGGEWRGRIPDVFTYTSVSDPQTGQQRWAMRFWERVGCDLVHGIEDGS